jgi:ATP-binding cassette subfamily F protein uup
VPDVLLLDEPTQPPRPRFDRLARRAAQGPFRGSVVVITHDRAFLDAIATRIVELDRGVLRSYPGNFAAYEARKAEQLSAEALANARADKLLAQEEVWVRKGVEARRTRSVGRVARLEALRAQRAARRETLGRGPPRSRFGHLERQDRRRIEECLHALRREIDSQGLLLDHPARRQGRPDRPERRGQDDAAEADPRRAAADLGHGAPGHADRGRLLRPDEERARPRCDARRHDQPGQRMDRDRPRPQARDELPHRLPVLAGARATRRLRTLSGGERNRVLLARLLALPANVLVSTSRPTTSTSTPSSCSRNAAEAMPAPCSW